MKVQLIVVQGKPEGKVIPLVGPMFRIGRGERCHLRPNSEEVSREHAEFLLTAENVSVRDLGSRNGTLVNGKAVKAACVLKDRDLVQVGPLTFAVSILDAPAQAQARPVAPGGFTKANPEDVSHDDIEAWLIADNKSPAPERPSGVYGGDTITINAFKDAKTPKSGSSSGIKESKPAAAPPAKESKPTATPVKESKPAAAVAPAKETKAPKPAPAPAPAPTSTPSHYADQEFERLSEGEGDAEEASDHSQSDDDSDSNETVETPAEEFLDESNPFYVKKKGPDPATPAKPAAFADTSDAARDILSKMMERKRNR